MTRKQPPLPAHTHLDSVVPETPFPASHPLVQFPDCLPITHTLSIPSPAPPSPHPVPLALPWQLPKFRPTHAEFQEEVSLGSVSLSPQGLERAVRECSTKFHGDRQRGTAVTRRIPGPGPLGSGSLGSGIRDVPGGSWQSRCWGLPFVPNLLLARGDSPLREEDVLTQGGVSPGLETLGQEPGRVGS